MRLSAHLTREILASLLLTHVHSRQNMKGVTTITEGVTTITTGVTTIIEGVTTSRTLL